MISLDSNKAPSHEMAKPPATEKILATLQLAEGEIF